jgi:hypothetical protein
MSAFQRFPSRDLGPLILRGAGFLLAATFGLQKIGWYWTAFHAGEIFISHRIGAVNRKNGFSHSGRARLVDHI